MDDQFVPNQNGGINAKQLSDTKDLQSIIIDLMKTNQPNLGLYNGTSVSDNNSVPQQKNYENDSYYQTVIDIYEYLEHKYSISTILVAIHQAAGDVKKAVQRILKNTYTREESCDFSIAKIYAPKEFIDNYFMVN